MEAEDVLRAELPSNADDTSESGQDGDWEPNDTGFVNFFAFFSSERPSVAFWADAYASTLE